MCDGVMTVPTSTVGMERADWEQHLEPRKGPELLSWFSHHPTFHGEWPALTKNTSCLGILCFSDFPSSYFNFHDSLGLGDSRQGAEDGKIGASSGASNCPKSPCSSTSKGPAWLGTTVRGGQPAPLLGETQPSPSTDPAPSATTARKEHCTLCLVPWGQ